MAEHLLKKLATVKKINNDTGKGTEAAEREVHRQLGQVSKINNGNPINGEGITKSGEED